MQSKVVTGADRLDITHPVVRLPLPKDVLVCVVCGRHLSEFGTWEATPAPKELRTACGLCNDCNRQERKAECLSR